jgi:3-oxoacyl-(acyl-carrier-protein) synthase
VSAADGRLHRVAVTGCSALSPGGVGVESYRAWLARPELERGGGATVPGFDPSQIIANAKRTRSMHRTFQLGTAASILALAAAALTGSDALQRAGIAADRAGLAAAVPDLSPFTADLLQTVAAACPAGSGELSLATFADLALHQLHPFRRLAMLPNMAVAHTSLVIGLQGPGFTFTSGGCAGAQTLHEGFWTVAAGRADLMICQVAESPDQCWRTPAANELAGALVLEDWSAAERRGAPILIELAHAPGAGLLRGAEGSPAAGLLTAILASAKAAAQRAAQPVRLSLTQALAPAWIHEVPA